MSEMASQTVEVGSPALVVGDLMRSRPIAVRPDDSIRQAFRRLCAAHIRHLLVMEGERLVGIITDRDIRLALPSLPFIADIADLYLKLDDVKVRDAMTRDVITVGPEAPVEEAVEIFLRCAISALPVVEGGCVVGIFTETDALRALHRLLQAARRSPGDGRGDPRQG